ncbi:MAG: tetratricopeptide repeat protein [Acidobacteriota bacterium]|nr:tetratricopeptide repeat protein [Acidobacteriota bacterium]
MKRFSEIRSRLIALLSQPDFALSDAALEIARLEYPQLDPDATRASLARFGERAAARLDKFAGAPARDRVRELNAVLFDEAGFEGDRLHYDDLRNSCLNAVVARRRGIPITLSIVYMDVAARAGITTEGVSFPGHFLVRCGGDGPGEALIVDPFTGGVELSETDCRRILMNHLGDDAVYGPELLQPAAPRDIVVRMLTNLKRLYVRQQAFADARRVCDLLLALDPSASEERRDRGLLSFHLGDAGAALRDLEGYLQEQRFYAGAWPTRTSDTPNDAASEPPDDEDEDTEPSEEAKIWDHVKTLRRRVASFN